MVNTTPKLKMELETELLTKGISFYSNHNFQGQRSIQLPNSQTSSNISATVAIQNPAAVPLANIHNIPWITGCFFFSQPKVVKDSVSSNHSVDGKNPTITRLRLVVYLIIYKTLYIPGGAGFLP